MAPRRRYSEPAKMVLEPCLAVLGSFKAVLGALTGALKLTKAVLRTMSPECQEVQPGLKCQRVWAAVVDLEPRNLCS